MKLFALLLLLVGFAGSVVSQEVGDVWSFTPEYAVIEFDGGSVAIYPIRLIDGEYQSELPLGIPDPENRPSGYGYRSLIEQIVFEGDDFLYIETADDRKRGAFYSVEESRSTRGFGGVPLVELSFVTEEGQRRIMVFHIVEGELRFSQGNPPIDAPMSRYSAMNRILYSVETPNGFALDLASRQFDPSR